jgi:hypothetical protein
MVKAWTNKEQAASLAPRPKPTKHQSHMALRSAGRRRGAVLLSLLQWRFAGTHGRMS